MNKQNVVRINIGVSSMLIHLNANAIYQNTIYPPWTIQDLQINRVELHEMLRVSIKLGLTKHDPRKPFTCSKRPKC